MLLKTWVSSCSTGGEESKPVQVNLKEQISLGHVIYKLRAVWCLTGCSGCTCGHAFSCPSAWFPPMQECSLRMCLTITRDNFNTFFLFFHINSKYRWCRMLHLCAYRQVFSLSGRVMGKQKDFPRYALNIGAGMDNRTGECLTAVSL